MLSREQKIRAIATMQEKAKSDLLHFILWTKPDYKAGWFHHEICRELDQFLEDVVAGKAPRLMLFAPPRHGKSEIVSRRFPAYAFGKHPKLQFIATSYSGDLAGAMNRDVQRVMTSAAYRDVFDTAFPTRRGGFVCNSELFELPAGGIYKCAGVGGGVTGRGGNILVIDDPVKDAAEAYSATIRNGVWDWYTTTLRTRCEPGGGMLLIMTRWHEDDLAGRILKAMERGGEEWRVVRYPAIAEENEKFRRKGEVLHADRYDLKALNAIRFGSADEVGTGSRVWDSLYQQRPSSKDGTFFPRSNWALYSDKPQFVAVGAPPDTHKWWRIVLDLDDIIQYWDTAAGGHQTNDYAACVTLGIGKNKYYVLDVWKEKVEFPELKREVVRRYDKWMPSRVGVEGGGSSSGKSTIQELSRDTLIPFVEVKHSKDKVLRANVIAPTHEAKLVAIPERATWVADFVDSCVKFPNAKNDDDVDAFMGAIELALDGVAPLKISDELMDRLGGIDELDYDRFNLLR